MERSHKLSQYLEQSVTARPWLNFSIEYYRKDLSKFLRWLIPHHASVIEFGSRSGEILASLSNESKTGFEINTSVVKQARKKYKNTRFIDGNYESLKINKIFDYVILTNIFSFLYDVQSFIVHLKDITHEQSRIVVISFNFLWKPLLDITGVLGLRTRSPFEVNWLSSHDICNFFYLEDFELIKKHKRMLFPLNIPVVSEFVNTYVSKFPLFQSLCLTEVFVFRKKPVPKQYSVSIIIPARNEEGNIHGLLNRIPEMGNDMEVLFIEGHSKDNTYQAIEEEIQRYKGPIHAYLYKQKGFGKRNAVELGLKRAQKELMMILDADLTVDPDELPKFYRAAIEGKGELIIGSRLVYPMEGQAMRLINYVGNKFFSKTFTFLIGQRIKDTLCGTKVFLLSTYRQIEKNRSQFGDFDPYGDFDLIFGASKLNFKITEIPVRYKERTYGKSNISRFTQGFLLLRMCIVAAKKLKFI